MRPESRDDDLTAEEHAQLSAIERREGAQNASRLLGISKAVLVDAMARKRLKRVVVDKLAVRLLELRGDPEPPPDSDLAAMLRGQAIVQAIIERQRNPA